VERSDHGANEGRLAGPQRAAQTDDVTRAERAGEFGRESLECGAVVEDVILRSQNSVWCVCV
jgi:hypothetical protein